MPYKNSDEAKECWDRYYKNHREERLQYNRERHHRVYPQRRKEILNIKGAVCSRCGYKEFEGSLDFHFVDGEQVRAEWRKKSFNQYHRIIVLCRNCHQALHQGKWSLS